MRDMVLVVGATGFVGSGVVRMLTAGGTPVRALVRPSSDPSKRALLESAGAELCDGDLKVPASLRRACESGTTVISTASATISRGGGDSLATVDHEGQLSLVEAARRANVRQFIYVSFSGNIDEPFPLRDAKRAVEQRLKDSGMIYTIVRPSIFMEVWLTPIVGFNPSSGRVRIYGTGDRPISMIAVPDVSAYVAGCVNNPATENQTIELGGPAPVTFNAVTRMFEQALGLPIAREYVPESTLRAQFHAAQDPLEKTMAGLTLAVARGDAIDVRPALAKVPIALTPVSAFVARSVRP
jgi:NADH dehydrogenase